MVKSVFIPYSMKMAPEAAFLARSTGQMTVHENWFREQQEAAESDLNVLLEDGYTIVTSHILDTSSRDGILIVLYKPDREIALQQQLMDSGLIDRDQDGRPS